MKKTTIKKIEDRISIILTIVLTSLVTLLFSYVWFAYYRPNVLLFFRIRGSLLIIAIYFIQFSISLKLFEGNKFDYHKFNSLIISQIVALILTNALTYLQISLFAARLIEMPIFIYMTLIDIAIIMGLSYFSSNVLPKIFAPQQILLVYEDYMPDHLMIAEELRQKNNRHVIKSIINIKELQPEHFANHDGVLIYDLHSENRNKVLKRCYKQSIPVYVTRKISDIILSTAKDISLYDTPVMKVQDGSLRTYQLFTKRLFDIIISAIALILLSPIMLITAIAIKLYDGGNVLFIQKRHTKDEKVFDIYKFRSMVIHPEEVLTRTATLKDDPRITPVGKFIRKVRIDELPQLINILKGDMSLVGPRPERIEHTKKYKESIPEFSLRLKVKGGLTGYAQIYGRHNTTPYDKLKLDLIYIQNYSLLLDLRLLLLTLKVILMKDSSEGFKK